VREQSRSLAGGEYAEAFARADVGLSGEAAE